MLKQRITSCNSAVMLGIAIGNCDLRKLFMLTPGGWRRLCLIHFHLHIPTYICGQLAAIQLRTFVLQAAAGAWLWKLCTATVTVNDQ